MKITKKQKAVRVLQFLMGLGNRRVQALMRKFGLSQEVISEGHRLLHEATRAEFVGCTVTDDVKVLAALDEFENTWFPICQATLRRHAPEISEWLFLNLVQTRGADLIVGLTTFLARHEQLASGRSLFGARGKEATTLLTRRGLTLEVIAKVQTVLAHLETFAPESEPQQPDNQQAEQAMWQWYLEWSAIARTAVKDRRLLRALGFLKHARSSNEVEETDAMDANSDDALTKPSGESSQPTE